MKKTCSSIALLLLPLLVLAEVNVRGTVLDRITEEPIAGATLYPQMGEPKASAVCYN